MNWGSPFDPNAEAIWVHTTLEGIEGRSHDLILVVDTGTPETIIEQEIGKLKLRCDNGQRPRRAAPSQRAPPGIPGLN